MVTMATIQRLNKPIWNLQYFEPASLIMQVKNPRDVSNYCITRVLDDKRLNWLLWLSGCHGNQGKTSKIDFYSHFPSICCHSNHKYRWTKACLTLWEDHTSNLFKMRGFNKNVCRKHSNQVVSMETTQILSSVKMNNISLISCLISKVEMQVIHQIEAL